MFSKPKTMAGLFLSSARQIIRQSRDERREADHGPAQKA
jgi:hypothetical protein